MSLWRGLFVVAGVTITLGGMNHPGGTMAEMLADPAWTWSHALVTLGFFAFLFGLWDWGRGRTLPDRSRTWLRLALIGTALQSLEMVMHTAAVVDASAAAAAGSTPVLTTHLVMAVAFYPVFGVTAAGFIIATARDRTLGSIWIAWLGVAGAVAHGLSAPLVVLFESEAARILFPMITLLALWAVIAALLPIRAAAPALGHRRAASA